MRAEAAGGRDAAGTQRERVNIGIAIVVPLARILEIFNEPALKKFESFIATATKEKFAARRDAIIMESPGSTGLGGFQSER